MGAEQKERSVAWPNHSNLFYTILLQAVFSIVHLLLVLCGDIEINPGPRLSESRSSPTSLWSSSLFSHSLSYSTHKLVTVSIVNFISSFLTVKLSCSEQYSEQVSTLTWASQDVIHLITLSGWSPDTGYLQGYQLQAMYGL